MGSYLTPVSAPAGGPGSSFAYSFSFLPKEQREALKSLYAFCRRTDDLVDNDVESGLNLGRLRDWANEFDRSLRGEEVASPILRDFSLVIRRFDIPAVHAHELLRGVEMDLQKNRYASFAELREYCYHVASSVGLMSLPIFRPTRASTKEYAVNLGIALQLTNIIRDVGVDARSGRIYLPLDEMARFRYSEREILEGRRTPAFVELMKFQAARARDYFHLAQASLALEDRRAMFAATIMERIYYHTLLRIERKGYDVFRTAVSLPRPVQLLIAVKYYLQRRVFGR